MRRGAAASRKFSRRAALRVAGVLVAGTLLATMTAAASLLYAPVSQVPGVGGGFSSSDAEGRAPGSVAFKPGEVYLGLGIREDLDYWLWIASAEPVAGEPTQISGAGVPTVSVGWPLLAFTSPPVRFADAGAHPEFIAATEHAYARAVTTAAPEFLRARPHRVLPGRILPLGFAVNTMLYAAVAGVALYAPGVIRRGLRRRAGRCLGCGYPLTGGDRCPECGAPALPSPPAGKHRGRRADPGGTTAGASKRRPLSAAVDGAGGTDLPSAVCPFAISRRTPS
jgi:hypothetical protein